MHIKSNLMGGGMTVDSYPASFTTASQAPPRFCSSGSSCAENSDPNERLETWRPLEVTMLMPRQVPPALTRSSSSSAAVTSEHECSNHS